MSLIELNITDDFPALRQTNRGKPLCYLDTASSAQKPSVVVKAESDFYLKDYANIHRGIYELSERATTFYEQTREVVRRFIHAKHSEEIVFTSGTTESINLVAETYARTNLKKDDEIILTTMEHHANIVPWYMLSEKIGIVIKVVPITAAGVIDLDAYQQLFSDKTKMVAISHASNAIGTINPVKTMIEIAHQKGAVVLVDGAQATAHMPVDVSDLDCDFYVFSGHKLYGPSATGVLYAKKAILDKMPPYRGGGDMIETVAFDKVTYAKAPFRFEAGTPNIAGVIGLSAAIQYLEKIGMENIYQHDQALLVYAEEKLMQIEGLRIIGNAAQKLALISFVLEGIHPHDIGTVLDHEGIAVRAGHHCAMPLMAFFKVPATVRASFGIYNHKEDVDALVAAILLAKRLFA